MSPKRFQVWWVTGGFRVCDRYTRKFTGVYENLCSAEFVCEWLNERAAGYELNENATQRILTA